MAEALFQGRVIGRKEIGPQRQFTGIELTGADRLAKVMTRLGEDAPRLLGGALFREANYIMTDSKREVPTDTGALKSSGHVEQPEINGTDVSVTLGYGGPAGSGVIDNLEGPVIPGQVLTKEGERDPSGYAVFVHEDLTAFHDDGKAKYLEDPALNRVHNMENRLAADLRRDLERLTRD